MSNLEKALTPFEEYGCGKLSSFRNYKDNTILQVTYFHSTIILPSLSMLHVVLENTQHSKLKLTILLGLQSEKLYLMVLKNGQK